MCTVTYIPQNLGYILTSNRDESPERGNITIEPKILQKEGIRLISPIDEKASGSWITTTETGITLCILNGGFENHSHQPPYAYSRGLIPFTYLKYNSTQEFIDSIDLDGVEPFTLVICENGEKLSSLVWDEKVKHHIKLDPLKEHIWSSSTLYDENTKKYKENLFRDYLENSKKSLNTLDFHTIGIENPIEPCVFIKREKVETVSTTVVEVNPESTKLFYKNYLKNQSKELHLLSNFVNEG